ncbi:alpha/beta hydrolase [Streptomyces sp. NPDC002643]
MNRPADESSRGVRRITLDAAGVTLSALLSEPEGTPRAVVVAVHGGGMNAGYFDGRAHPHLSLLTLGASLGHTVLAVDRPGYGHSAARLPEGQGLADQATALRAALSDFASRYSTGAGLFPLAHSYGGKVALTLASDPEGLPLLGLDISGCGHVCAVEPQDLPVALDGGDGRRRSWGPLGLYPPGTFGACASVVEAMPSRERAELARWPLVFRTLAPDVRVPVRFTFAEHEAWWRHDEATLADLVAHFTAAPRVTVDRQPDAGHNISLGRSARSYHLRALAFLEDCLIAREAVVRGAAPVTVRR